jgi:hypothetical protein
LRTAGWLEGPRIAGAERAKNVQQYGEHSTDLDSILLDSTTEFLLEARGRGA